MSVDIQVVTPQDTIQFDLSGERSVVNPSVKWTASIVAVVTPEITEQALRQEIKNALGQFCSETLNEDGKSVPVVWQFGGMQRQTHASGLEQVTVLATTRVHERDNHALDRRRRAASRDGLSITAVHADTAPTNTMIQNAESDLRIDLLKRASDELVKINKVRTTLSLGEYRLGEVDFTPGGGGFYTAPKGGGQASNYAATMSESARGDDALGNAVKITINARVKLVR